MEETHLVPIFQRMGQVIRLDPFSAITQNLALQYLLHQRSVGILQMFQEVTQGFPMDFKADFISPKTS
jgi:hypothetical protein